MSEYLKLQTESYCVFTEVATELDLIANSLRVVGNDNLAKTLRSISGDIRQARDNGKDAFNQCFSAYTGSVQQGTANMLNMALGMAGLKDKEASK